MAMEKPRDVTVAVDKVKTLLVEYLEEMPPLVSNPRPWPRASATSTAPSTMHPRRRFQRGHINDGKPCGLDPQQDSPFFGELADVPNDFVSSIENNMLRAPMVKHQPETTDFLVVKNNGAYYLKEVDSMYLAGQTFPFVKVPVPDKREQKDFERKLLRTFIYKRLNSGSTITLSDVFDEFPFMAEATIRKELQYIGDFKRGGGEGHWTLQPPDRLPKSEIEESIKEDPPETIWCAGVASERTVQTGRDGNLEKP